MVSIQKIARCTWRAGRMLALTALFALSTAVVQAQNYSSEDTVTEYPNKGTYYHDRFEGRKTSNGEIFDQNKFTAAHWKIKLGIYVMVTNRNSGLQVIVRVNDRCPKRGVFDLSHRAANAIGIKGMQPVTVRLLKGDWYERWAAQETMFDSVYSRLNPAPGSKVAVPDTTKAKKTVKNTVVKSKTNKPAEHPKKNEPKYDIDLGIAKTHGEALAMIDKLPEIYRDKVLIETLEDSTLQLTLELRLPKSNVDELCRALHRNFKQGKVKPCE